jgi:hypothetical protein
MSANPAHSPDEPSPDEPSVVGVKVRPVWSMVLYGLLVLAAAVAFYTQRTPGIDPLLARGAPWIFLVFALGFSIYRIALVVARRYSPFKAFIQIFLAALFFLLLLFPRVESHGPGQPLFQHPEERVRAQAAELAGFQGDQTNGAQLVKLLDDSSPQVRAAAHRALVKLNAGTDLGETAEAWRARFP